MISRELAQRFIDRISRHTNYNINIMDERGVIIASRDAERVGQYHEIAHRVITGSEDVLDTTGMNYPNVRPGINMVIEVDHVREGVVGVTGDPEEIRPVAQIVKMSIETMLKYERQQERLRLRANKKEHFIYMITQVENSSPDDLRALAEELGYPEEMIRIPVLIRTETVSAEAILDQLRGSALHTSKDFSLVLDASHVIVFKSVPVKQDRLFSEYKDFLTEYLSCLSALPECRAACFVGSFQDTYPQYIYAYRHCRWLERRFEPKDGPLWFYDHAGAYLEDAIPLGEMQHIFHIHASRIPPARLRAFLETAEALLDANFRFAEAADRLYVHKNTLVYRYNALKRFLQIDPISSAGDREFLSKFCLYCRRISEKDG